MEIGNIYIVKKGTRTVIFSISGQNGQYFNLSFFEQSIDIVTEIRNQIIYYYLYIKKLFIIIYILLLFIY